MNKLVFVLFWIYPPKLDSCISFIWNLKNQEIYKSVPLKINCPIDSIHLILMDKAEDFSLENKYSEEEKVYKAIISLPYSSKFEKYVEAAYLNLYSLYVKRGDFSKANSQYFSTLKHFEAKANYQGLFYINQFHSSSLLEQGFIDEAESLIKKSTFFAKRSNIENLIALANRNQGYFYKRIGNSELSISFFEKAFRIYYKLKFFNEASLQLLDIGYIYYNFHNNYNLANQYYFKGLTICDQDLIKLRLFDNIGASFWKQKNYQNALYYYQKGLLVTKNINFFKSDFADNPKISSLKNINLKQWFLTLFEDKAICWLDYYKATGIKSHLNHALDTYVVADQLVDLMRQEHTGSLSKYFWRNKTRSLYENAIETCFLLKDYEKAYYFMEKSRAVMLNDKLNELGAKQKLNETDQEKERDFQRKIIELNTKIEAETKATEKEKLNSQLFDLQEQQERFVKSLETKYPAYYQLKYNTQIGTLKQMQAYLKTNFKDKNATMVSYFFGDSASYAMVISPNRAEVKQFKYDVAQNQEFVNLLATNQGTKADYARILSMGSVIYQKLIKPLNIPKGHLIISQDGVFMPFEALRSSANNAQYLLKDYAISYTYSGQFLLKKATETKFWPNQIFVGFAPVEFKNQLNTLKNSDITLGNVAKNYWFSDTFTGKVATKANFLQQAKDHKIVQIFTHAFADSVDTEPKIYFADQALKISELNAEDQFNTQLLVLSACKTGVGKLAKGEGVLSLARGFSMLGIPATITSLWSVEDKNTYQLSELFYKHLNQGLSKDEALQKAKLEFMEFHPNAGPTDWAGMVLVGETDAISSNYYLYFSIFLISVLILFLGFRYFYRRNALNKNPFYEP